MVQSEGKMIHNSTFNQEMMNSTNIKKHLWKGSCGSGSISSIEKYFDPVKIKQIVESLVMSRFGLQYNEKYSKSTSRRSRNRVISSSTSNNPARTSTGTGSHSSIPLVSNGVFDSSINTCNLSELISAERQSSVTVTSKRNDVMNYLNTYVSPVVSAEEVFLEDSPEAVEPVTEYFSCSSSLESLSQKMSVLTQNKEQILKAIYCHEIFNGTAFRKERLEAEKLLLITDIKSTLLLNDVEETFHEENITSFCSGTVEVSGMHLWPEELHYFDQYFICLIIHGSKVYASEISRIKSNGVIYFNKKFQISSLQPVFKCTVKIYSISEKVLKKPTKSQLTCHYRPNLYYDDIPVRESLFTLWGEGDLKLSHLSEGGSLQIKLKSGLFTASISSYAHLNINLSGFLNISDKCTRFPLWNRQWCVLTGRFLKYFNYPPKDLYDSKPTNVIDLGCCRDVRVLTREKCARKQTLMLETKTGQNVLISCETRYEFEYWKKYLEIVISQLKLWENCSLD